MLDTAEKAEDRRSDSPEGKQPFMPTFTAICIGKRLHSKPRYVLSRTQQLSPQTRPTILLFHPYYHTQLSHQPNNSLFITQYNHYTAISCEG